MSLQRNYYEVLGLPPGATTDQIKKKYRELARMFHPDIAADKVLGQRIFTQINQAYSVLGDPDRRAQYNGTLAQNNTPPTPPQAAPQAAAAAPPAPSQASSAQKTQAFAEMLGRAENAIMAGKLIEARAFCVRVLETDPQHVRAMEILGDALAQMGRPDEAAVQYRRALQLSPSTLIQTKLSRALQSAPSTRTVPPSQAAPSEDTDSSGTTDKSGGLLGRLLGRK